MTIDEAIEILTNWRNQLQNPDGCQAGRAFKLGIEALYRLKRDRAKGDIHPNDSLPGETK